MNVPFTLRIRNSTPAFLTEAKGAGLLTTLKGHRSVGGMRASIYNAMPEAGVDGLVEGFHGAIGSSVNDVSKRNFRLNS
jgi:phosphoserine aminotransferase